MSMCTSFVREVSASLQLKLQSKWPDPASGLGNSAALLFNSSSKYFLSFHAAQQEHVGALLGAVALYPHTMELT